VHADEIGYNSRTTRVPRRITRFERGPTTIACPSITKSEIRTHYDLATLFYRLFWGPHIHHGLWEGTETPAVAQQRLIEAMAERAAIRPGDRVIDVGCGMGGSSVHLAKHYDCRVTGITLSLVQRMWATAGALVRGASRRTTFRRMDAEAAEFPPESFDVLWSIECTEHLFDKPAFFRKGAGWLAPGGRLTVCAWLAGDEPLDDTARRRVYEVCEGFLCPSLGTAEDYRRWITDAGLEMTSEDDWTERVMETWEICRRRVLRSRVRWLASALNRNMTLFIDRFDAILDAYRTRAMRYGCFTARRPARS
jgi:tocopherol O-methyltransferase